MHTFRPTGLIQIFALAISLGWAGTANAQWATAAQNEILVVGGWLFDGTGEERIPNPGIHIRNGLIMQVGPGIDPSTVQTVMELDDTNTILPGFIDLHAHYNYDLVDRGRAEEVRYTGMVFLANGVTSTWSAGEYFPQRVLDQRDRIDRGEEPGPRLFASGPYMGAFRCEYSIDTAKDDCIAWPNDITEAEIRAEIDHWARKGVISLKIKQATPEEARIIIDQANRLDMTTAGHLSNYDWTYDVDPRDAIPMGLRRLEHNITLGNGGPRSSELDEVIDLMLEYGVYFGANLQMYGGINLRNDLPGLVWTDESRFFTPYARELLVERGPPAPESAPEEFSQRLVELRQLHASGGAHLLVIGTDEPVYTQLLAGFAYHRELMTMVWAGIPEHVVLKAATLNGARSLGVDDRLGSVEAGKLADLVIVNGNPLVNIRAAREIESVIKNGEVHCPEALLKAAEGRIGPAGPQDHAGWTLQVKPFRD